MKRTHYAKLNRKGNIKLGTTIATFSKLYSDMEFETKYGVVKGSCKAEFCNGCKKSCYVKKSYRYGSVINGHARNTLAIREDMAAAFDEIAKQIERAKKPITIVRVHQSGEIESTAEFLNWCKLARRFPAVKFYVYTKAFPYVIPALLAGRVPENFVVNLSVWHEYGIKEYNMVKHLQNVKAFAYDDGYNYAADELEINTYCMAYDRNGKMNHDITCEKCKKCFNKTTKVIGCYEH